MRVKLFDENHEKDLELVVNKFLIELDGELIDIKYQIGVAVSGEDQIFCFSAMVIYKK